ncbi:hypothetical protein R1sor_025946 [Riccia sorocarpa]|uniref:Cytochrome P450 n=1 Tax=Riccia sorocarpa TaxID=122646 RepID=A0ABD3GAL3_9MARC
MWNEESSILSQEGYITLIIVLAVTVLWLLWSASSYFRNRNRLPLPPGPSGFPFIGQTFTFLLAGRTADGSRQWIQNQITKYVQVFKVRFMGNWVVMLEQPEGNKFIFQTEGTLNHIFWPSKTFDLLGPDSVDTMSGEQHKLLRRNLNRYFDHSAMSRYLDAVNRNAIRHFTNHWQGKEQVVALDMTNLYTFSTICNLLMSLEDGPLMDKLLVNCDNWAKGLTSLPINLPGCQYYEALKARKVILEMLDTMLEQRRREISDDHLMEVSKMDVLSSLLTVPEEKGTSLPDSCIKDNFLLMLVAGFDTSARTLAMTIYYIAKNPSVYEEILNEHKLIMEGKRRTGKDADALTMEDISAMKYMWNVIKEVLRLDPPAYGGYRKTVTDMEYSGFHIPKGWLEDDIDHDLSSSDGEHQDVMLENEEVVMGLKASYRVKPEAGKGGSSPEVVPNGGIRDGSQETLKKKAVEGSDVGSKDTNWTEEEFTLSVDYFTKECLLPSDGMLANEVPRTLVSDEDIERCFGPRLGQKGRNGPKINNCTGLPQAEVLHLFQVIDGHDKLVNGTLGAIFPRALYAERFLKKRINWAAYAHEKHKNQIRTCKGRGDARPTGPPVVRPHRVYKPLAGLILEPADSDERTSPADRKLNQQPTSEGHISPEPEEHFPAKNATNIEASTLMKSSPAVKVEKDALHFTSGSSCMPGYLDLKNDLAARESRVEVLRADITRMIAGIEASRISLKSAMETISNAETRYRQECEV